jgi:hypothetical protein
MLIQLVRKARRFNATKHYYFDINVPTALPINQP